VSCDNVHLLRFQLRRLYLACTGPAQVDSNARATCFLTPNSRYLDRYICVVSSFPLKLYRPSCDVFAEVPIHSGPCTSLVPITSFVPAEQPEPAPVVPTHVDFALHWRTTTVGMAVRGSTMLALTNKRICENSTRTLSARRRRTSHREGPSKSKFQRIVYGLYFLKFTHVLRFSV